MIQSLGICNILLAILAIFITSNSIVVQQHAAYSKNGRNCKGCIRYAMSFAARWLIANH